MRQKIPYILTAIVIVVGVLLILNKAFNKTVNAPVEVPNQSTESVQTQIANAPEPTINSCPNGTDLPKAASGKFVANVNIENKVVTLETTKGNITVELFDKDAPKTVENFVCLVAKGYYDGITFHRVASGFVVQAGDPTGTGAGGESIYGKDFEDELYPTTSSYKTGYVKGVLAMANRGPNTNSSQFFITLDDVNSALRKNYTIFGRVTSGMDVVEAIGKVKTNPPQDGKPVETITIKKATLSDKQ